MIYPLKDDHQISTHLRDELEWLVTNHPNLSVRVTTVTHLITLNSLSEETHPNFEEYDTNGIPIGTLRRPN